MKREFSKVVLGAVMILYFAGAIYGAVIVWQDCSLLGELLAYIGAPTAVAIGFYAWKAKAENVIKISAAVEDEGVLNAAIHNESEGTGYDGYAEYRAADNWSGDRDNSLDLFNNTAEDEVPRMAQIRRRGGGAPLG
jgi:hypothetical protein